MKKLVFLLVLLFIPFLVNAELTDVEIKKVELVNKSPNVVELEPVSFEKLKLKFKLKYTAKDEFARYQLTIKNNSNKDYEIDNTTTFNDEEFIKYQYLLNSNEKVLKANSEITLNVMITYCKELAPDKFVNGKYIEDNSVSIELSNTGEEVIDNGVMRFATNPNTSNSDIITIVVILAIMSVLLALFVKSKKGKVFIIIMMLLIPVMVYAIEKIKIEIETHVEIEQSVATRKFAIIVMGFDGSFADPVQYEFEERMTLEQWVASPYNTDNYQFDYGASSCDEGKRFIYANMDFLTTPSLPSLMEEYLLVENNNYVVGIGKRCPE